MIPGIEWILAKIFLIGKEFHDQYRDFRVKCGDVEKDHYQVALRSKDGELTIYISHIPTGKEEAVKSFQK